MITLTDEQQQALKTNGEQIRALDPVTSTEYVLVRADIYARLQPLLEDIEDDAEQAAWVRLVGEAQAGMANE